MNGVIYASDQNITFHLIDGFDSVHHHYHGESVLSIQWWNFRKAFSVVLFLSKSLKWTYLKLNSQVTALLLSNFWKYWATDKRLEDKHVSCASDGGGI